LGAGDYEDDDGIDLTPDRSDRDHPLGAEESSMPKSNKSAGESTLLPSIISVSVKGKESRVRWNRFKWTLVVANTLVRTLL